MIRFTIPYPRTKTGMKQFCKQFSLNSIYVGKHWSKRHEDAEYIHSIVKSSLIQQSIPRKIFSRPVKIKFWWNDRLDVDNHAYLGKLIVDALKGYLIQDDSRPYFRRVTHDFGTAIASLWRLRGYDTGGR